MTTEPRTTKTKILQTALEQLKTDSLDDLTARQIADRLNCSVQPIFYNFSNMDELKAAALQAIHELYLEYMSEGARAPLPYKGMGLAYIKFARDYPNYFKLLFMNQTDLTPENFITQDDSGDNIIRHGMAMTGFDEALQRQFHIKIWIFTHGLATLVASNTVQFSDADIERLLAETTREIAESVRREQAEKGNL